MALSAGEYGQWLLVLGFLLRGLVVVKCSGLPYAFLSSNLSGTTGWIYFKLDEPELKGL
jgi:hypothetical protein